MNALRVLASLAVTFFCSIPAAAQTVRTAFAPSSEAVCQEDRAFNDRLIDDANEEKRACQQRCLDLVLTTKDVYTYSSICGGNVLGVYSECQPLDDMFQGLILATNQAYNSCLRAVQNTKAAEIVYDASKRETVAPVEIKVSQDAALELNSQVSTGNAAVDKYREEVGESARNATTNIITDATKQLNEEVNAEPSGGIARGNSSQPKFSCAELRALVQKYPGMNTANTKHLISERCK